VEARYPSALVDVIPAEFYSERDAEQAIGMAEAVVGLVRNLIEGDQHDHPELEQT
jgi:HEPN domain-containing protein